MDVYICQNKRDGRDAEDKLWYKYSWNTGYLIKDIKGIKDITGGDVKNIKILNKQGEVMDYKKVYLDLSEICRVGHLPSETKRKIRKLLDEKGFDLNLHFDSMDRFLAYDTAGIYDYETLSEFNNHEDKIKVSLEEFLSGRFKGKSGRNKVFKHAYIFNNQATFTETLDEAKKGLKEQLSADAGDYGFVCENILKISAKKTFQTNSLRSPSKKKAVAKKTVVKKTLKKVVEKASKKITKKK